MSAKKASNFNSGTKYGGGPGDSQTQFNPLESRNSNINSVSSNLHQGAAVAQNTLNKESQDTAGMSDFKSHPQALDSKFSESKHETDACPIASQGKTGFIMVTNQSAE